LWGILEVCESFHTTKKKQSRRWIAIPIPAGSGWRIFSPLWRKYALSAIIFYFE
jgi:hypothetical protein